MTVLEWLDAHPALWGYVIIPLLGFLLNEVSRLAVGRWPRFAKLAQSALAVLPALPGAYERMRTKVESMRPPPMPVDEEVGK